jgi:hypothetical protein
MESPVVPAVRADMEFIFYREIPDFLEIGQKYSPVKT